MSVPYRSRSRKRDLYYCQRGCAERVLHYPGESDVERDLYCSNDCFELS